MRNFHTAATMSYMLSVFLALLLLSGCKDAAPTPSIEATVARAKGALTGERLPEMNADDALQNHGFSKLLAWAEEGDKKAQHLVAVIYLAGTGVPKNFAQAEKWALRAANQGSPASQFLIGVIRRDAAGLGDLLKVEPNLIRSYMWLSLAAAQGHQAASVERDRIQTAMDPAWVIRAQTLAAAWHLCTDRTCWDQEL